MSELTPIIKDSFLQFSGAVLQSRALPDAADNLKPSARQIFYCLYTDHFVHNKPFQKTLKAIGSAFRVYIHGDSSAEGVIMRAGQPFAMRYPLVEVEGSYGTLIASGSWSAPRYTSARLSELANYLFADLDKETIKEWRDNYDDTEKYPMHLPSKGFYNIVNGSYGIGCGASCSIPQYNLREVNEALIKLLWDSNTPYDDIYCTPDFATGAILLNPVEVKESMEKGEGAACKLRSVINYDSKERCLIVTEIPYMVYTETLCRQLEEIINDEENNPGIERFNDLTGKTPLIKIYLSKKANPDKVMRYLYKNTSLQSHYGVNFTMLDRGRYPKVFGWRDMLQAHLNHEIEVYTRGFQYDLKKCEARIHILDGLIAAYDMIDEVVATIKSSQSSSAANTALQKLLSIDETQAKAILDLKLAKLSKLDISKLKNEHAELAKEVARIEAILNSDTLLRKEVEKGLREVADKFGDERRTKIMNLQTENDEPVEISQLQVSLTNKNNIFATKVSSLYSQKRGGVGNKLKLDRGEYVVNSINAATDEMLLFFTKSGLAAHCSAGEVPLENKTSLYGLIGDSDEEFCALTSVNKNSPPYILFITRQGMLKKSSLEEYNIGRKGLLKAIALEDGDEIVNVIFTQQEKIGILTKKGQFLIIESKDIRPIGRVAKGVRAIKLNVDDTVISARAIPQGTTYIASISGCGLFKKTPISDFVTQTRYTKGNKIQKINDLDWAADFFPIVNQAELLVAATSACIKLTINDIPTLQRESAGNKAIKLNVNDNVVQILFY